MQRRILILFLVFGLAGVASAAVNIIGYLYSEEIEPVQVDSVYMLGGLTGSWFLTPGWSVNAGETDTFEFPEYPEWPSTIIVCAFIAGIPVLYSIDRPRPDSWYDFEPPFEQVRVMFHIGSAVKEKNQPLVIEPTSMPVNSIATNQLLLNLTQNRQIEIINPLGQTVRTLPLAPGVYCYRFVNAPSELKKLTIVR